jgi:nitronate monooxygenase
MCRLLTSEPFGVNITLLPLGAKPDYPGIVKVIIEEGIKVVETAGEPIFFAVLYIRTKFSA